MKRESLKNQIRAAEDRIELLRREVSRLREHNEMLDAGAKDLRKASDALLVALGRRFGEEVYDDETGELIGWRISLERPSVEALKDHRISARIDQETDRMVIGIIREEATGDA